MLITDLSRSKNLTILSRQQLRTLLDRAGHQSSEKITLDEALDIAQKSKATIVIMGSFARLGEQIRIDAQLHDARDGQLLAAERLVVDQPAQILTQVDVLSLKLASHLGGSEQPETAGLTSVMTNDLAAYRYYSLGVEKAQVLRDEEALVLLQKAVALDPNFAMAYARMGYVYGVTGNSLDKAKPYLEKAFHLADRLTQKDKLNIQAWYAIVNYDFAAAIEAFRRIIAAYPLEVEAYRRLATLLRGEDKFAEAVEVLKQALVIDSGERELCNSLGQVYSEMGRHDDAIAMFQRYVQLAPEEPNAYDSLALGYQWAGRYGEAIREYDHALQLKPDFEVARLHLGNVYFDQGRYRAAVEEFQRLVKITHSDYYRGRGLAVIADVELRRGNISLAEREAKAAGRLLSQANFEMFFVATTKDDLATARQMKDQLEQNPYNERGMRVSSRPMWVRRGFVALKSNSAAEAIDDFKEALKHRPQTWSIDPFEDCLANAYLELGRPDEAIAEYDRILKLNPNYPLVHYHLAQTFERKGQADRARAEYKQFLEIWRDADSDIREVVNAKKALSD
jgi:tetratricopeptide (TPR) repeat protein